MVPNKKIKESLLLMIERDQKMRKLFMKKRSNWNANVDMKNTEKLKKIINKYGWPGKSLVGEKAADAAWLIAQHADHDVKFQEKCLCLIKKGKSRFMALSFVMNQNKIF